MAENSYIGIDGTSKKIGKYYIGVNGLSKKVKKVYVGNAEGKAKRVFHEHGDWVETTIRVADCMRAGTKRYTCGYCDYYYDELIPKTAHKYVAGKCKYCGQSSIGGLTPILLTGE